WVTAHNRIVECRDALALPAGPRHAVLLRRIEAVDGAASVRVLLDPRAGFGSEPMRELHRLDQRTWTARSGSLHLRWTGSADAGGGMVAAATMGLPGRADGVRNYDYRYVWIRDQSFAGVAVASSGPHQLPHDAVHFVSERLLADGDQLRPAYRADGSAVPDQ